MIFLNNLIPNLFAFVKYNTLYEFDSNVFWMVTSQYIGHSIPRHTYMHAHNNKSKKK